MAKWAIEEGFKEAVLIGGLDSAFRQGESELRVVPTTAFQDRVGVFQAPLLDAGLYVSGPLAVMLATFEAGHFPAVAILPYAAVTRPDSRAAASAIERICRVYGLSIDVSELVRDAESVELALEERRKRAERSYESMFV